MKPVQLIIALAFFVFCSHDVNAQLQFNFGIPLPAKMTVNLPSVVNYTSIAPMYIGGANPVNGGTPPYQFTWSPSAGLDNPFLPNPLYSPNGNLQFVLTVTDAKGCEVKHTVSILPAGMNEDPLGTYFEIYPNPSSGLVYVNYDKSKFDFSQVEICDLIGARLISFKSEELSSPPALDLSGLKDGLYIISFIVDGQKKSKSITILR